MRFKSGDFDAAPAVIEEKELVVQEKQVKFAATPVEMRETIN